MYSKIYLYQQTEKVREAKFQDEFNFLRCWWSAASLQLLANNHNFL